MTNYYEIDELINMGIVFAKEEYKNNIKISRSCHIYGAKNIILNGNNIRIDDFTLLSATKGGSIVIGNHVHISAYCFISASEKGINIGNGCAISVGCKLFGACDDFSGEYLVNPTIVSQYTNVFNGVINICPLVVIGANCVVMPDTTFNEGVAIGANSFIPIGHNCPSYTIWAGSPIRFIKPRKDTIKELYNAVSKD